jgi:L-alanine-DL-glutamate epimerase-like enolase superfamily enzyme
VIGDAAFDLPLAVDGYELEPLSTSAGDGYERSTLLVRLRGGGHEGLGEDIAPSGGDPSGPALPPPPLALGGEHTLRTFCDLLATLDQWPQEPEWAPARGYRNWAFESAALDLALRQAGRSLPEVLGREPRPLRFVNSLGLGDPPDAAVVTRRLERYPDLRFKVDAAAAWTPEVIGALAATGAVDVVDFKGQYGLEVQDEAALAACYERVLDAFPDALIEDPHDLPAVEPLVAPHAHRVSYDAPIHGVDDLATVTHTPRTVNVKPCRVGGLARLFALYEHCEREGIATYSGGMGELGVGRGQAQLLSSMFHPDAPNDIAPSAYNARSLPPGLPVSPLGPPRPDGFRWA